jgi:hypothetical protein
MITGKPIKRQTHWPAYFTDAPQTHAAVNVHLKETVLGLNVPLRKKKIMLGRGIDVGNPPAVADDFDRPLQAIHNHLAGWRRQRAAQHPPTGKPHAERGRAQHTGQTNGFGEVL